MIKTYIFCFFCCFFCFKGWGQLHSLIPNPLSEEGCAPLNVSFGISGAFASGDTIRLNYGDGTSTNKRQNIYYVTYKNPGIYNVSLKVYNSSGNLVSDIPTTIKVGLSPAKVSIDSQDTIEKYKVRLRALLSDYSSPFPYTYAWTFGDGTSFDDKVSAGTVEPSFVHNFTSADVNKVSVTVTDELGCTSTGSSDIYPWNQIEAPNAFTPDGLNPQFIVTYNGQSTLSLKIFTRSGVLVYKTEAQIPVWDGMYSSGIKASAGVYYYVIETNDTRKLTKTGFVYLFR